METERNIPPVAINWLVQNPTVSNVVIGARNEKQLIANLDAVGWNLNDNQIVRMNEVSFQEPIYPHWVRERLISDEYENL